MMARMSLKRPCSGRIIALPAALVAMALVVNGCAADATGSMVVIAPPETWTTDLAGFRADKDEHFRTSADTPLLATNLGTFEGLDYWEPEESLYYVGPIRLHAQPEPFEIVTTSGQRRPCERFGWIEFELGRRPQTLQVYRLLDQRGAIPETLLLPFTDGTTGKEGYPAGRYIDLKGPRDERPVTGADGRRWLIGPYVLDFNRAFNPSCAYGAPERFACPVTPRENRLAVRIEAGERGFVEPPPAERGE